MAGNFEGLELDAGEIEPLVALEKHVRCERLDVTPASG